MHKFRTTHIGLLAMLLAVVPAMLTHAAVTIVDPEDGTLMEDEDLIQAYCESDWA